MTIAGLAVPVSLLPTHDVESFACGVSSLDVWLRRQSLKNEAGGASRTYVVCIDNSVVGYYCLAAGAVTRDEAPKPMQRNMPEPIPVMVLGRLAVDRCYQDKGIGSALLRDAILRGVRVAETVGIKAILVHAISEEARAYYLAKGLLESPIEPMTRCLVLETARRALSK